MRRAYHVGGDVSIELSTTVVAVLAIGAGLAALAAIGVSRRHRARAEELESRLAALEANHQTQMASLAQQHARAAAEARRADTARREFVGNVSHELRTPLASLKALVETLEEGALDDPPAAREFVAQMHVEVDSMTQLVQELLELSRIESGQAVLRQEAVSPVALLEDAERRLRRQDERVGLTISVEPAESLPDVWADAALLERVLINLLHNAVKFTPRGGRVTMRAAPHDEGVRLSVTDTGIGIAAEELGRIFERFYKVDRSRSSRGTGLGLAIAKHIVQAHGGRLWAESEGEGRGSTFHFILPVVPNVSSAPRTYTPATVS